MKIEGKTNIPNPILNRAELNRAAMVETPEIIGSSFRPLINTAENRKLEYIESVDHYSAEASDRVKWLRGGGERNLGTRAATATAILAEKHSFKSPRNPAAMLHPKRVQRG